MEAQANLLGTPQEWSFLIEPEQGVSIWQALADADPQGFLRVEVYPNMTARVVVYERLTDSERNS